jgi:hypothetical protein
MAIISFFVHTDRDIMRDIKEDARSIKLIGEGIAIQQAYVSCGLIFLDLMQKRKIVR